MIGPCAKATVTCTLILADGRRVVGSNLCLNAQEACPRAPGEDYVKCGTICNQAGHAEIVALMLAGEAARGSHAFIEGHTYACRPCQEALFGSGVVALTIGAPPHA